MIGPENYAIYSSGYVPDQTRNDRWRTSPMKRRTSPSPAHAPDRRKADRLHVPVRVTYRIKRDAHLDMTGNTTVSDLGGGGLRLMVSEETPLDTVCELTIHLPEDAQPLTATGTVTWCRKRGGTGKGAFEIGVELTTMGRQERERYYQFICDRLLDHYLDDA